MDALEQQPAAAEPAGELPDAFFALSALRERVEEPGGVVFAGSVALPGAAAVEWQYGRGTEQVPLPTGLVGRARWRRSRTRSG